MKATKKDYLELLDLLYHYGSWLVPIATITGEFRQLVNEHFKLKKDFELVCKLHDNLLEENKKMKKMLETFK